MIVVSKGNARAHCSSFVLFILVQSWILASFCLTFIIKEETAVTIDTAVRLARYFGTTPLFWVNLQTQFDLAKAIAEIDVNNNAPLAYA